MTKIGGADPMEVGEGKMLYFFVAKLIMKEVSDILTSIAWVPTPSLEVDCHLLHQCQLLVELFRGNKIMCSILVLMLLVRVKH